VFLCILTYAPNLNNDQGFAFVEGGFPNHDENLDDDDDKQNK
jgi:hypothetical protein